MGQGSGAFLPDLAQLDGRGTKTLLHGTLAGAPRHTCRHSLRMLSISCQTEFLGSPPTWLTATCIYRPHRMALNHVSSGCGYKIFRVRWVIILSFSHRTRPVLEGELYPASPLQTRLAAGVHIRKDNNFQL